MRSAPLHDGTCSCGHEPDDDGIIGGQGRTASSLRDGYVVAVAVFVAIVLGIALGLWLACR